MKAVTAQPESVWWAKAPEWPGATREHCPWGNNVAMVETTTRAMEPTSIYHLMVLCGWWIWVGFPNMDLLNIPNMLGSKAHYSNKSTKLLLMAHFILQINRMARLRRAQHRWVLFPHQNTILFAHVRVIHLCEMRPPSSPCGPTPCKKALWE